MIFDLIDPSLIIFAIDRIPDVTNWLISKSLIKHGRQIIGRSSS